MASKSQRTLFGNWQLCSGWTCCQRRLQPDDWFLYSTRSHCKAWRTSPGSLRSSGLSVCRHRRRSHLLQSFECQSLAHKKLPIACEMLLLCCPTTGLPWKQCPSVAERSLQSRIRNTPPIWHEAMPRQSSWAPRSRSSGAGFPLT